MKVEHEHKSASQILSKLEQSLPIYDKAAASYTKLENEGFYGGLAAAEKQREALEKAKDLEAQSSAVAPLRATIAAQKMRINQIRSSYHAELEKELAEVRLRIGQLKPSLDKSVYLTGLMELRAPQNGVVKELATTTVGAVVQPGSVVLTIVPEDEPLFADVSLKNEDAGFAKTGQSVQIKLTAYPFQRHGMLTGKVIRISADANDVQQDQQNIRTDGLTVPPNTATFKARVRLDNQVLNDAHGNNLIISSGMQVVAEINHGQRTVLEYLLSPVRKTVQEAARER